MELKWIVGRQWHIHATLEEWQERVTLVRQKEGIVWEWGHGETDLVQVE